GCAPHISVSIRDRHRQRPRSSAPSRVNTRYRSVARRPSTMLSTNLRVPAFDFSRPPHRTLYDVIYHTPMQPQDEARGGQVKIRFIGLGVMGAPMARNLIAAGHPIITVLNRSPLPENLEAEVVESAAEVARKSEIVITMLPDTPDVERVLLGANGVLEGVSS